MTSSDRPRTALSKLLFAIDNSARIESSWEWATGFPRCPLEEQEAEPQIVQVLTQHTHSVFESWQPQSLGSMQGKVDRGNDGGLFRERVLDVGQFPSCLPC